MPHYWLYLLLSVILYFDLMKTLWGWNNFSHIILFLINNVVLDGILYIHIWYQHNGMDPENSNIKYQLITYEWSWGSVFGVVYVFCAARMKNPLSVTSRGNRLFSNPQCPEGLWGAPRILFVIQRLILSPRQTDRCVKPTPHFSILLTLTLGTAIPLFPYVSSWCGQGHVYLYLYLLL
jgi:hypothetical protein